MNTNQTEALAAVLETLEKSDMMTRREITQAVAADWEELGLSARPTLRELDHAIDLAMKAGQIEEHLHPDARARQGGAPAMYSLTA